jgi:tetratricopeptide (TPR) repeat protein
MNLSLAKSHALAAVVAGLALAAAALATALGWNELPRPFIWLDVAVVYILAALPLAASFATAVLFQLPRCQTTFAILLVESVTLVFLPQLYIHARCTHDVNLAVQLSRDSRYGEARTLLHRVLVLRPKVRWNGSSVADAARNIDDIVRRLEQRVAPPLPENPTSDECIERAELLAILGRTADALAVLDRQALADSPQVDNLRGIIHETRGQWAIARDSYARGRAALQSQPDSPARLPAIQESTRGIAFCERKLGHLHQADAAWQQLLALAPTAETHMLLAQFYEDTQQTAKAQFHAEQATQLAPANSPIPRQARQLQNKLLTSHFGCLGIISDNWLRPPIPLPSGEIGESATGDSRGEGLTK